MMPIWDDVLTDRDRQVFAGSGHGARVGFGERPALLVIDVTYRFAGDNPEPILQSIQRWPRSCGEEAWHAVMQIQGLLEQAHRKGIPVIYTRPGRRYDGLDAGRQAEKHHPGISPVDVEMEERFVAEIAPRPVDLVIAKPKPSAFFGTPLAAHLIDLGIDSLILTGGTTSGCVRATAVDGYSYNYRVTVVQECVFDRGQTTHKIALFDMNAKYADVVRLADVSAFLETLDPSDTG